MNGIGMGNWWQTRAGLEAAEACAVDVTWRDGRRESLCFHSRTLAELYLHMLPELQVSGDEEVVGIVEAMVRPLGVGAN